MSGYIRGMVQEVRYGGAAEKLWYTAQKDGQESKPDAAPQIAIYSSTGSAIVAATNMTAETASSEGWLDYDAQTAEFEIGELITAGTSGAKGYVRSQKKTTTATAGSLYLVGIDGTFGNDNALSGSRGGAATANGTAYTCNYYYALNASSTSSYPLAEDYYGKITFVFSSVNDQDWLYFDVVAYPYKSVVTSADVDRLHPDWSAMLPDNSWDWTEAIKAAHREVSRLIRVRGNRPACIVQREQVYDIELAFVEAEIAKRLAAMPLEQRYFWMKRAAEAWNDRGEFKYIEDSDAQNDSNAVMVRSQVTR